MAARALSKCEDKDNEGDEMWISTSPTMETEGREYNCENCYGKYQS